MPARRRIPESEADDNFSVLIGDTVDANEQKKLATNCSQQFSGDSKKEFITGAGQRFVGNNYSVAGFAIPNGLTKLSSSIGQFLQQQVTQANEERSSAVSAASAASSKVPIGYGIDDDEDDFDFNREPEIIIMASRDRTGEFFTAIRSMHGRNIAVNIRDPRKATQLQSYSEFMMTAKMIGKHIASTYSKLEKLTLCMWIFMLFTY